MCHAATISGRFEILTTCSTCTYMQPDCAAHSGYYWIHSACSMDPEVGDVGPRSVIGRGSPESMGLSAQSSLYTNPTSLK